jgi:hypothetical protein
MSTAVSDELMLWLFMVEGRQDSGNHFHPYLVMLPTYADDPLHWPPEFMRAQLCGTQLYSVVEEQLARLRADFESLKGLLDAYSATATITFDGLLWARSMYTSRSFPSQLARTNGCGNGTAIRHQPKIGGWATAEDVERQGKEGWKWRDCEMPAQIEGGAEGIMLPLIDILNHSPDAAMSWVADEAGIALLAELPEQDSPVQAAQTNRQIAVQKAGAELCNNYGSQSNSAMLLKYGFCLEGNLADTVVVWLDMHESATGKALFDHQLAMLRGANVQIELSRGGEDGTKPSGGGPAVSVSAASSGQSSDDSESDLDGDDGSGQAAGARAAVVGPFILTKTGAPCYEGTGEWIY